MDDLDPVAIADQDIGKRRTRDDFEIALDRHLFRIKPDIGGQVGDRAAGPDASWFSVQDY